MNKYFLSFILLLILASCSREKSGSIHNFNGIYSGDNLNRIAFPMGGIGSGMICLEGTGAISHVSVRNHPDITNEPQVFAAITILGKENTTRVLEGPVPDWKILGKEDAGNGLGHTTYGLPRFGSAGFLSRFPFAEVRLADRTIPLGVTITGWSPFIPGESNKSSLPVAALEYTFTNKSGKDLEAMFSFNSENFMQIQVPNDQAGSLPKNHIDATEKGFVLVNDPAKDHPEYEGSFAAWIPGEKVTVDHCWFRGGWWDPMTMCWKAVANGSPVSTPPVAEGAPGASLFLPFRLGVGESKTIRLLYCWYVPCSDLRQGNVPQAAGPCCEGGCEPNTFSPWYTSRFNDIGEVIQYWSGHYDSLRKDTETFTRAFYSTDLPDEVKEAVAANLAILKSPTVLRLPDGSLWCWEGCHDSRGCCYGSCTHVWNYAQAIPHLFPSLERSLRYTEFLISQNPEGHQAFRSNLPLSPPAHDFHAAVDGQLGGIMKAYREWRISGNQQWLLKLWPAIKSSMDYCIRTWDPKHRGIVEEPHHNTYDIEFWGPDGMCSSFYLGALKAMIEMGSHLGENVDVYRDLLEKGSRFMESELFNGEYFIQKVTVEGLTASDPVKASMNMWNVNYSPEALELLKKEGPKYQYANGCLSDGVLGFWIAEMCGLEPFFNREMITEHLRSVYRYNLRKDLGTHVNPQRPGFAMGSEGGLLLCTWPAGDAPSLPFVYSNEVWTGIEYQVASHLMAMGEVEKGLEIVRTCRKRYDGRKRNPFDEYECGHWYARAMASYGMIQGLTGIRYDAVDRTLYIDSRIGDNFTSFLSTESGFGNVGLKNGEPFVDFRYGTLPLERIVVSGKEFPLY
jgi:uncharacterized protein (DUF608 family)